MNSEMLELDMALHRPQSPQNSSNPPPHQLHHPNTVAYPHHEFYYHLENVKHLYTDASKQRQHIAFSNEDEAGFNFEDTAGDGRGKTAQWHRMKWTDTMVRLLIMAVYYAGDEWGSDANDPMRKKVGGLLRKKGKWKSVSQAMLEKGHRVSPQQCEDKFNDLNKRYKRVNDILGKGTACKVVEDQRLLDKSALPPKLKEEARKLLNSKHLFYREMHAYHSSCGHHGDEGVGGIHHSAAGPSRNLAHEAIEAMHNHCLNSSENASMAAPLGRAETEGSKMATGESSEEDEDDHGEDVVDDYDTDDEVEVTDGSRCQKGYQGHEREDEGHYCHERSSRQGLQSRGYSASTSVDQLSRETISVLQDRRKTPWEKKQWTQMQLLQLEEQHMGYQYQAFELEKQRLKWIKFSSKKEREMERAKLENERRRLQNERMVLLVRQKEVDLLARRQQR